MSRFSELEHVRHREDDEEEEEKRGGKGKKRGTDEKGKIKRAIEWLRSV